jgi:nucleoside-diphosphate-sugar epimerase
MTTQLVLGAGPVGTAIARQLVRAGHEVRLGSRSGRGDDVPGASRVAVDAGDARAVTALARDCTVIYNALNPVHYHRWPIEWPPMWRALMAAAADQGTVLATVSNLYGYGRSDQPMREDAPLRPVEDKGAIRVSMWREALAAHQQGRFGAVEVRGSDYLGAGASSAVTAALRSVVTGAPARLIGSADVPHSWTYTGDVARLIVAAAADPAAHGRAWHVPTNPSCTQRELLSQVAVAAGRPMPTIRATPPWMLRVVGLVNKPAGAAATVAYQFTDPFVIDDTATRRHFGLAPTPWSEVLRETIADLTPPTDHAASTGHGSTGDPR